MALPVSDPMTMGVKHVAGLEAPKAPALRSGAHAGPSRGATQALPQPIPASLVLANLDGEAPEEACFRFDAVYSLASRAPGAAGLGAARAQALLKRSRCIDGPVEPWMNASNPRPAPLGPFGSPAWPVHTTAAVLPAAPTKTRRSGRRGAGANGAASGGAKTAESQQLGRGKRRAAQRQALTVLALLEGPEEALPAATPKAAIAAAEILAGLRAGEDGGRAARTAVPPSVASQLLPPSVAVSDAALGFDTHIKGSKRGRAGSRSASPEQNPDGAAGSAAVAGPQQTKKRQKLQPTAPFTLVSPLAIGLKAPLLAV